MTLTAVLFVGGLSRRMGVEKATLKVAGEPLWARQLRVLRELQPDALCLSARSRPPWCPADVQVILDEPPSRGPLSGLASALRQTTTTHVLALPVDLPRMTSAHLRILINQTEPGRGVIPVSDGRFEPLCAIYPKEAGEMAHAALGGTNVSLRSLAEDLLRQRRSGLHELSDVEKQLYHNLNSPADLESAACIQTPY